MTSCICSGVTSANFHYRNCPSFVSEHNWDSVSGVPIIQESSVKITASASYPPRLEWQCFFCDVMFPYGTMPGGEWNIFNLVDEKIDAVKANPVCQRCTDKLNMKKGSL